MVEMQQYEKRLVQALDCPKPLRRCLLERVRQMAEDFRAGKPDAAWDEVEEVLGDPQELARTMMEAEDQEELAQYRKRKLWLKRAVGGSLIVAFLVITGLFIYVMNVKILNPPVIAVEETLTVTYPTED